MRLTVDGRPIEVKPGQTVAAVLHSLGRGRIFCGIGVCFDCVVTVNGVSEIRACQRVVADGDDVWTES